MMWLWSQSLKSKFDRCVLVSRIFLKNIVNNWGQLDVKFWNPGHLNSRHRSINPEWVMAEYDPRNENVVTNNLSDIQFIHSSGIPSIDNKIVKFITIQFPTLDDLMDWS
jgi:hypothetical protein